MRSASLLICLALLHAPIAHAADPLPHRDIPGPRERLQAETLDQLFDGLRLTKGPNAAKIYAQEIQNRFEQSGSDTADLLLSRAAEAVNSNDNALALDVLDQLIQVKPDFAEAWNKRGTVEFLMKDYGASLSDIRRTLALQPRHFGALTGLGIILEDLGKDDEAILAYRRALEINPRMDAARTALDRLEKEAAARST